ncbi:hypothetical protein MES5069_680076 [Mesorhizobium escarrei]|uniref:Uncharacterized protein n=1 Tax=Mesorhizobium escarrei TaxID=666018 RepID=A0ABM9EGA0_9HYPH|nr:hypothetical protein MES5069_680076 [Mesorhizobium escarrei]
MAPLRASRSVRSKSAFRPLFFRYAYRCFPAEFKLGRAKREQTDLTTFYAGPSWPQNVLGRGQFSTTKSIVMVGPEDAWKECKFNYLEVGGTARHSNLFQCFSMFLSHQMDARKIKSDQWSAARTRMPTRAKSHQQRFSLRPSLNVGFGP